MTSNGPRPTSVQSALQVSNRYEDDSDDNESIYPPSYISHAPSYATHDPHVPDDSHKDDRWTSLRRFSMGSRGSRDYSAVDRRSQQPRVLPQLNPQIVEKQKAVFLAQEKANWPLPGSENAVPMNPKKAKKEQERLQREQEKERRAALIESQKARSREVMRKREALARVTFSEWSDVNSGRVTDMRTIEGPNKNIRPSTANGRPKSMVYPLEKRELEA